MRRLPLPQRYQFSCSIAYITGLPSPNPDLSDSSETPNLIRLWLWWLTLPLPFLSLQLGFDFELTYFDNPQINLPSSCVNWVTTTGESGRVKGGRGREGGRKRRKGGWTGKGGMYEYMCEEGEEMYGWSSSGWVRVYTKLILTFHPPSLPPPSPPTHTHT